jgi:hypothetical protein
MKQQTFTCNGERFTLLVKIGAQTGATLYSGNGGKVYFEKPVNAIKSVLGLELKEAHLEKMRNFGTGKYDAVLIAESRIKSIQERINAVSVAVAIDDD